MYVEIRQPPHRDLIVIAIQMKNAMEMMQKNPGMVAAAQAQMRQNPDMMKYVLGSNWLVHHANFTFFPCSYRFAGEIVGLHEKTRVHVMISCPRSESGVRNAMDMMQNNPEAVRQQMASMNQSTPAPSKPTPPSGTTLQQAEQFKVRSVFLYPLLCCMR